MLGTVVDVNVAGHIAAGVKVAFEVGVAGHIAADIGRAQGILVIVLYGKIPADRDPLWTIDVDVAGEVSANSEGRKAVAGVLIERVVFTADRVAADIGF